MKIIKLKLMQKYLIYLLRNYKIGGNYGKSKTSWTLAKANPKISAAVVVVIVAIYFLVN